MTQHVTIGTALLSADIAIKGAELQSLIPAGGTDVMWSGDPEIWGWHAPNLFPIVGALVDDTLVHEGKAYPMKQHGFLRHSLCEVVEHGPDACALRLRDNIDTRAQYPFAFALTVTYRITDDRLNVAFSLHNPADTPLYASIGAHPAFRWPLGSASRAEHVVLFERSEPAPIRRLVSRQVAPDPIPTPVAGHVLRLADSLFDYDALIFDRLASRKVGFGIPGGASVELGFPDFPDFGIWTKPAGGGNFLCLEPWQGLASPMGFTGEFSEKPGVVPIAPGETRLWRYWIRPAATIAGA